MLTSGLAFDHYIINVHLYYAADQRFEDLSHQSLVSCSSIFEFERHDLVTIEPMQCYKGGFFLILWSHGDLVVSEENI